MAKIYTPVPVLKLNDGNSIPMLAYGTGTAWSKSKSADLTKIDRPLVDAIKIAIGMGYYHLDCSESYNTEPEVGVAIQESGIPREKLFIASKASQNVADIPSAIKATLKRLQVDYLDLYVIHTPFWAEGEDEPLQKAWKEMEALKEQGLTKSIGVSNYVSSQITATLATANIPPAVNQIEFHPYLQHTELLETHKKYNIATVAYGSLAPVTKESGGPVDDFIAALTKKYAVSKGEILLRWCVDQDVVAITTSSKEQRLSDYLRAMTFKLTPTEIKKINELGGEKHFRAFWKNRYAPDDRS